MLLTMWPKQQLVGAGEENRVTARMRQLETHCLTVGFVLL